MSEGSIEWLKVVPVALSVGSLVWNYANWRYTTNSNRRNIARSVTLDEFRAKVRNPLDVVLRRAEATLRDINQLANDPTFPGHHEDSLIEKNKDLMSCLSELHDCLLDADESKFSSHHHLLDLFDPFEDQIMNYMNGLLDSAKDVQLRVRAAKDCKDAFRRNKAKITEKVEKQVQELLE